MPDLEITRINKGMPMVSTRSLEQFTHLPILTILESYIDYQPPTSVPLDSLTELFTFLQSEQKDQIVILLESYYSSSCVCLMHQLHRHVAPLWWLCLNSIAENPNDSEYLIDLFAHNFKKVLYSVQNDV
jgi:hypothetical protein